jgi:hypothetical protein
MLLISMKYHAKLSWFSLYELPCMNFEILENQKPARIHNTFILQVSLRLLLSAISQQWPHLIVCCEFNIN